MLYVDRLEDSGLSYCKYVGALVKYLYEKIYFRLACYFFYFYSSGGSIRSGSSSSTTTIDGCYCCSTADGRRRKRQAAIMNNNSKDDEKISGSNSHCSTTTASKSGTITDSSIAPHFQPPHTTGLLAGDENRFALTKQPGTIQNPSRSRPVSRPLVASVPNPKETVLPTAFVSPQTVQISVQPSPNGTHSPHLSPTTSSHPSASLQQQQPSPFPSPPPTPRRQGPSLSALVAHYLSPNSSGAAVAGKIADAYCGDELGAPPPPPPPYRRMSMAAAVAAASDRPWANRRSWVAGGTTTTNDSLVSFRTDYSPTEDLNPVNRSHRFSLDSMSFGGGVGCSTYDVDAAAAGGGRRFGVAAPSTRSNVSASDERLNELERRLRLLESRLPLDSITTADFTPNDNDFDYHHHHQQPNGEQGFFSRSMKDLSTDGGGRSSSSNNKPCRLPMANQSSSSYQNLLGSTTGDNCDKVQFVSQKIRDLQKILEEDRTNVDWRRTRVDEYKQNYNNNNEMKNYLKTSQSLDDLMRERNSLQDTVENLQEKLEKASTAANLAPDQYVTMQRYRLLKAKSKKLLQDKCEALRAAILEKESALVRMQLQNKELSELRRKVYEHECQCKVENGNQDENSGSGAKLEKLREELSQLCKSSAQISSCLLGVCRDVSNKRCPDYDQILGLKTIDDEHLQKSLKSLRGSTGSLNSCPAANVDPTVYTEQLVALHKCTLQNLNQMQKLMVDYYTNELVESVDCRIQ